jgi:hypothetical protein
MGGCNQAQGLASPSRRFSSRLPLPRGLARHESNALPVASWKANRLLGVSRMATDEDKAAEYQERAQALRENARGHPGR